MNSYVALRFRKLPVVHSFQIPPNMELQEMGRVVAKTQHGTEMGIVLKVMSPDQVPEASPEPFVKEILRPFTDADKQTLKDLEKSDREAFTKARALIQQHKLAMKLLRAEYLFDSTRLILYYKAETKVDFRELLKSLASTFRTRIELRQIGVRDETKLLGGIGCCGKEVCCAQFMTRFHPVSTKMAKDQNLSMNPAKLSGICCRLLCCIAHEHNYYAEFQGKYPKVGAEVLVGTERGRVMDINYLTQKSVITFGNRTKTTATLAHIFGRKDKDTGRNLWWVQEPGQPEPDLTILLTPIQPPMSTGKPTKDRPPRRDNRNRGDASTPGASTPGASTPGASTPGASTPGASTPGASTPGSPTGESAPPPAPQPPEPPTGDYTPEPPPEGDNP